MKDYYSGSLPLANSIPDKKSIRVGTGDLYLRNLSERDRSWDKHRANSDRIAGYYREAKKFEQYATRIDFCSQLLNFKLLLEDKELKFKLDSARFCRVRHCRVCQWRRSLMWKARAYKVLPTVVETYPNHRWLFLTLTVCNCSVIELRDTLQWMSQSWRRMIERKNFPAIGWIRSTEVTRAKDGLAHPHFHCLLLIKPGYFGGRSYIKQKDWVKFWRSCLRVDYDPVVDIRAVGRENSLVELVPEILKYSVKESDLVADREWFIELTKQMHKMRTVATGGVLKKYLNELEEEPEDLIGKDETKVKDEIDEVHLCFGWERQEKKYRLISE